MRRRPISSTLPILLDRDWERDQDCFLGALLGFFSGSPSSDRGLSWPQVEDLSRVWFASSVSRIPLPFNAATGVG